MWHKLQIIHMMLILTDLVLKVLRIDNSFDITPVSYIPWIYASASGSCFSPAWAAWCTAASLGLYQCPADPY